MAKSYPRSEWILKLSVELPQLVENRWKLTGIYQFFASAVLFFLFSAYPLKA
jgi:hypothetical protein